MKHEHPSDHDDHCYDDPCRSGKRNRYFKGKHMTAADFGLEQNYGIERRRLLNRAIHGWGVVYGFKLDIKDGKLVCGEGLALDGHGRELFRAESGEIPVHRIMLLGISTEAPSESIQCLLSAHYAERRVDTLRVGDACGCGDTEWNHVCETVVFSLLPLCERPGCLSAESLCLACGCRPDDEEAETRTAFKESLPSDITRGPHRCLCHWLMDKTFPAVPDYLCQREGFKDFRIAVDNKVPLACVTIVIDECKHPVFKSIDDPCTPRRLIKTNDLLFDLVRGCDLTHITDISWWDWHRSEGPVGWPHFEEKFPAPEQSGDRGRNQRKSYQPVTTGFSITFSAPVKEDAVNVDCVVMTCLVKEKSTGWIKCLRVPIEKLEPGDRKGGDPDNTCRSITLIVSGGWCDDEIWDEDSELNDHEFGVEIEIRGDFILDCHGLAVDANANGTPGGTLISTFRVTSKTESKATAETTVQ